MTEPSDEREGQRGDDAPSGALPSARDQATQCTPRSAREAGSALPARGDRRRGKGKGGRRGSVGPGSKPTPARARDEPAATAPAVPPDVSEATLRVGDERWTVAVLGRSGGSAVGAPPLLLLEFRQEPATEAGQEGVAREALVVARTLAGLSEDDLERAWRQSTPPRPPERERPFFSEGGGRARR